jgi:hypothetical protein
VPSLVDLPAGLFEGTADLASHSDLALARALSFSYTLRLTHIENRNDSMEEDRNINISIGH